MALERIYGCLLHISGVHDNFDVDYLNHYLKIMLQQHDEVYAFKRVFACEHPPLPAKPYVDMSIKKNITGMGKLKSVIAKGKRETDLQKVVYLFKYFPSV